MHWNQYSKFWAEQDLDKNPAGTALPQLSLFNCLWLYVTLAAFNFKKLEYMTIVVCLCNSNIWSSLNKLYILFPDEDRVAVHFFLSVLTGAGNLKNKGSGRN